MEEAEIGQIDIRYEGLRLKDRQVEESLLVSILESGIQGFLLCMLNPDNSYVLLDGFKRFRCAKKLGIGIVPVHILGVTESEAILELLRTSEYQRLSVLDQAALVDELNKNHSLSASDIARRLNRSAAWVSLRLGLMDGMCPAVRPEVFGGRFPVRAYMYTLRPFTRVKGKKGLAEVEAFVPAVSGKELSVREIEFLWHSYINAGPEMKNQILNGDMFFTLAHLKRQAEKGLSASELKILKDLEWVKRFVLKIPSELQHTGFVNPAFFEKAGLLISDILSGKTLFIKTLEDFLCSHKTESKP